MTSSPTTRPSWLRRVSAWAQRRHWTAIVCWLLTVVAISVIAGIAGSDFRDDHSLPGSESQQVLDELGLTGDEAAADSVTLVVHDDGGLNESRPQIDRLLTRIGELAFVDGVNDPLDTPGSVADDGNTATATITLDTPPSETSTENVRELINLAHASSADGLVVEVGGDAVRAAAEEGSSAELLGLLAAVVILVPLFGSALAAAMPLLTAILAVGSAVGVVTLASHAATIPSYAVPMMMLVGLGVGIDYALLVFARFRHEITYGASVQQAGDTALDTAGRSVVFAGTTVIVALLGMLTTGLASLQGLAFSVAATVLATVIASITLLPALLALFGPRLERRILKRKGRGRRQGHLWRRVASVVQRWPIPAAGIGLAALVVLSLPALDMRLGFADAGTDAPGSASRQAYELIADGFGPGANGPLIILTDKATSANQAATAIADLPRVNSAIAGVPDERAVLVIPDSAPSSRATTDLVHTLRSDVLPDVSPAAAVGGSTAATIDFSDQVADRLPYFIGAVVGLSVLLLLVVFRSVLIAVKAALLNVVSIGAALGVMTYVFGRGNLGAQPGPIEAFLPVLIFAVVFGLSMDYEVFLVSRIYEEWRRTNDSHLAVREGLATTGSVITAAAGIMIVVFGSFLLSPDRMLQQMGLGLAVAVLVDAFIIRCLVVPAILRLLGDTAWWTPAWLGKILPRIRLE